MEISDTHLQLVIAKQDPAAERASDVITNVSVPTGITRNPAKALGSHDFVNQEQYLWHVIRTGSWRFVRLLSLRLQLEDDSSATQGIAAHQE
jgi:hypothetical protein